MTHAGGPLNALCASLPGAEVSQPFGPGDDIWKVGGKIFAALGEGGTVATVKTDGTETAEMLIAAGLARKAPYFHRSWVQLPAQTAPAEQSHRIEVSYRLIRAALPRKVQAGLPPLDPPGQDA